MSVYDFEFLKKLGQGAFSNVFQVKRKSDSHLYALKKVKLKFLKPKQKQNALNQVRILASIQHPNIIAYKDAFIDPSTDTLCIVMQLASQGDLFKKIIDIKKRKSFIPQQEIWSILIQVVKGLKALHQAHVVHRDLKSANIFLFADGTAKLGDLNVSKVNKNGLVYTQTGTPYYASPQVWKDQPYNFSSDIWSLGCVIYQLAALVPPFYGSDMKALYRNVIRGQFQEIPTQYSLDLANVIRSMLQVNSGLRPSCERILKMKVVKKYDCSKNQNERTSSLLQTIKFNYNTRVLRTRLPGPNYQNEMKKTPSNSPVREFGKENRVPGRNRSLQRVSVYVQKGRRRIH